jgi:diguanylate cyclase (GGDEF)-like protein
MLDEEYRKRLDKILGSMAEKGYGKPEMQTVVDDFKSIYDPDARIDESEFRAWYQDEAIRNKLSPDPDDPRHFYNYRAAFRSGAEPDETGHWPSKFKREGHPDLIIDGVDTRTNEPPDWDMFQNPSLYHKPEKPYETISVDRPVNVGHETITPESANVQLQKNVARPSVTTGVQPGFVGGTQFAQAKDVGRVIEAEPQNLTPLPKEEEKKRDTYLEGSTGEYIGGAAISSGQKLQRTGMEFDPDQIRKGETIAFVVGLKPDKIKGYGNLPAINKQINAWQNKNRYLTQEEKENLNAYAASVLQARRVETGKKIEQYGKEMVQTEYDINPVWVREDRFRDKIAAIEKSQPGVVSSWQKGNLSGSLDILIADAFASGNEKAIQSALALRRDYNNVYSAQTDKEQQRNWFGKVVDQTSEMLPMMGKGFLLNTIPVIGQALSQSMWARQGAGQVLADMEEQGIPRDISVPMAFGTGLVYAGIEGLQVKQLGNIALRTAIKKSLTKNVARYIQERGVDFVKENAEEILQNWVQKGALETALEINGVSIDHSQQVKDYFNDAFSTFKQTAGPMGLLGIAGGVLGLPKIRGRMKRAGEAPERAPGEVRREDFIPEQPAPVTPAPPPVPPAPTAKVVKKTGDITQTYVPGEQGAIETGKQTTTPEPATLSKTQENVMEGRLRRADEMVTKAKGLLGDQVTTKEQLFGYADALKTKLNVASFEELKGLDDAALGEKLSKLNDKEQAFVETMPLDELDAYALLPAQPQETPNVQQEEKGVQVAPPQKKEKAGEASLIPENPSDEEISRFTPEQKDVYLRQLKGEIATDQLTGLMSRRGASAKKYMHMEETTENGEKVYEPVWDKRPDGSSDMIVLDIDNFGKGVNNYFGHRTGDRVLTRTGGLLSDKLQGLADVVRYGGEEIAIIPLPNADRNSILNKVEEARDLLHQQVFKSGDEELSGVTFSAGYGKDFEDADSQLYKAKESGKARTFSEGKQYAENDLQPTPLREPRRRAEDTAGGAGGTGRVLPAAETTSPAPTQEVTPQKKEQPQEVAPPAEPSPKAVLNALGKQLVAAQKAEKKAQKRAKKKVPKSLSKRIIVKNSKELPPEAKQMLGEKGEWEAAVWYNPHDEVIEVHINENLSPEKYAEALYHEIPGHLGQRLVFADSPALLNTMRQMYGAAKARGDIALKGIEKAYKAEIERAGAQGDDLLFEEWTAHNLHRYLNENDKASLPTRIYNLFRSALLKIGVIKQKKIDDVLRSMVKKMRKAKDAGIIEKAISENFKRPIYDIESAKAIAQEYGLEYSGSEPSKGGPNYLFTHRKSGTQFRAKTREEVGQAVGAIADRVAPKGTVKAGEGIRFKKPVVEEKPELPQPEPREKITEPGIVDLTVNDETKGEAFRRVVTDRYHRLRRLMETAEEKTGTPLPDELNAYVKQDIIQSKVKARIDKIIEGAVNKIADIAQAAKLTVKEIEEYLYAKHAPEANRVVAKRRPDMVEKGLPPSGMTDEEAQKIIDAAEKSGKKEALERISGIVQKWNRARLDGMVEDKLLSQEQRDAWERDYEFYVPLKGGLDEEGNVIEGENPRTGKGYSVKGAESHMRSGRYTKAQNILAYLASDTAEKVVRGEKNRVIRSLYDFSEKFKNDLILTEPVIIKKTFNKEKGIFEDRELSNFEIGLNKKYGTPISFKLDGKPMQMLIKDKPLMRAMTDMGSEHGEIMAQIMQGIATINRYLAITRTQLSLNFIPSNALRDTLTAQLNAIGLNLPKEKQQGLALDILKTVPKALKWAYEGEMGKSTKGADAFNDFVENGGAIEFLGMRDIEDSQKKLEHAINGIKPGIIGTGERVMRGAYDYVTKLNSAVENANRLATYTQLVKRGVSKQQAAYIAKNITVNFNRKGKLGSFLNAWALFANAGIQGSVRILKTLRDSPTVRAIAGGIIATSLAHAELMRLFAGDDPEDEKNYYDKISDFTRDTHIVIPWGKLTGKETKAYQRIPLPYGYNVFWAAGQHISRVIHGGVNKIPEESLHLIGAVADAFNPIGGSIDLLDPKAITRSIFPTILQPIAEIAVNQNFMGAPTYQERKVGYGPQPTYSHAGLKSTPQAIKNFTAWASDITGGGKYREGIFDKFGIFSSPDVINHLVEFATGGTGKVVTDLASLPFEWISNKKIPAKGLPIVQRFYGEINEYKDVKTLYDNLDKGQRIYNQFKEYTQTDKEKAKKLLFQYPAMISMMKKKEGEYINKNLKTVKGERIPLNLRVIKPLKAMNEQKKKYDESGNKEGVKRMEKMIVNHAQTWNKRLEKMLEPLPVKEKNNE